MTCNAIAEGVWLVGADLLKAEVYPVMSRRPKQIAAEFLAEMARNPEWVETMTENRVIREAGEAELAALERPIRDDLAAVGVNVGPWELVNTSTPYPEALPILVRHLERGGYPDRILEGLGRAMAVRAAAPWWPRLCELYLRASGPDERAGLASALAAAATESNYAQLVALVEDKSRGASRVFLLSAIERIGGDSARPVLEAAVKDDALRVEASEQIDRLDRRGPRR